MEPEEILGLSNEALAEAIAKYQSDLDAALANENPTREDAQAAREMHETLSALEAEKVQRDTDAADLEAMRANREEAKAAAQAAQEAAAEQEKPEEPEDEKPESEKPEAVTASARQVIAGRRPETDVEDEEENEAPQVVITAAAEVPNYAAGANLDGLKDVGLAAVARMQAFSPPSGRRGAEMQRYGVAQFRRDIPEHLITDGSKDNTFVVSEAAARESALPGGSLVAAGGWCAPSEQLYDLCAIETTDGIWQGPEFEVRRGGIITMDNIPFDTLYGASGIQTEAQAEAGTAKTCYEIECVEGAEVRLDASYLCIKIPLLTQAGYPELVSNTMERALIAYQHRQSADVIGRISTAVGAAEVVPSQGSTAASTLTALELVSDQRRQDFRLSQSQSMEVLVPFWVKAAIRADLALRNGVDLLSVTDAQIQAAFAARNLFPQWLYNWQPNEEVGVFPATFDAIMYPAGTFRKGMANVIRLDAVYDAASLATNVYTGLFFEEGILVHQACQPAAKVTIAVCSGGRTGAADNTVCLVAGEV